MLSCVLIVSAELQGKANALAEAMGWGPNNYSVPLSATGGVPVTHWSLHAWGAQSFVDLLASETMPPELEAAGYPAADYAAVMAGLISSVRGDVAGHFGDVLAANGFQIVEVE